MVVPPISRRLFCRCKYHQSKTDWKMINPPTKTFYSFHEKLALLVLMRCINKLYLSSTLLDIAADNIPKTSPFPKRKAKPWFDEDCQAAKKERNKANRLANKHPSAANSMRSRLIQARTKKLFKQKKRDSLKNYVSSVNVNTPSKKVWNMIRKITGKNVASPMHHIKDENGTQITDRVQIANNAWCSYWTKFLFKKSIHKRKTILKKVQ